MSIAIWTKIENLSLKRKHVSRGESCSFEIDDWLDCDHQPWVVGSVYLIGYDVMDPSGEFQMANKIMLVVSRMLSIHGVQSH